MSWSNDITSSSCSDSISFWFPRCIGESNITDSKGKESSRCERAQHELFKMPPQSQRNKGLTFATTEQMKTTTLPL